MRPNMNGSAAGASGQSCAKWKQMPPQKKKEVHLKCEVKGSRKVRGPALGIAEFKICEQCKEFCDQAVLSRHTSDKVQHQRLPLPTHGGNFKVEPIRWGLTVAQLVSFVETCMVQLKR